ncbi:MAG: hypothetical protein VW518_07730, partial [Burkholderiaceae bacterium]
MTRRTLVDTCWALASGIATGWALAWPHEKLQWPILGLVYGTPVAWLQWVALLALAWVLWHQTTWRLRAWLG